MYREGHQLSDYYLLKCIYYLKHDNGGFIHRYCSSLLQSIPTITESAKVKMSTKGSRLLDAARCIALLLMKRSKMIHNIDLVMLFCRSDIE